MYEHDEELEIYDDAFKNYFEIKAFYNYVSISLKLIAYCICVFLSSLYLLKPRPDWSPLGLTKRLSRTQMVSFGG